MKQTRNPAPRSYRLVGEADDTQVNISCQRGDGVLRANTEAAEGWRV